MIAVAPATGKASVNVGEVRPAAWYAWFRAVRSSVRWTSLTQVLPGVSVGSVQANGANPRDTRLASIAPRNSVKWTLLMSVLRAVSGLSVNVNGAVVVSVTVEVAVAVLPAASRAVTVSTFDPV